MYWSLFQCPHLTACMQQFLWKPDEESTYGILLILIILNGYGSYRAHIILQKKISVGYYISFTGAGIAQWSERWTCVRKVAGSNPCWSGGIIFFSTVNFLCWLLYRYSFHPRVTAVARKRPRSFCQKCSYTRIHLTYVALHEVTWCIVVWCTQNVPRWQQFHVAPAMPAL